MAVVVFAFLCGTVTDQAAPRQQRDRLGRAAVDFQRTQFRRGVDREYRSERKGFAALEPGDAIDPKNRQQSLIELSKTRQFPATMLLCTSNSPLKVRNSSTITKGCLIVRLIVGDGRIVDSGNSAVVNTAAVGNRLVLADRAVGYEKKRKPLCSINPPP